MVAIEAGISEGDIQAIYIVAFNVVVIISSVQTVPVDYGGEYFCFRLIRVRFSKVALTCISVGASEPSFSIT